MPFSENLRTALTCASIAPLIIQPVREASKALAVTRYVGVDNEKYIVPTITEEASADWIGRNQQIPASEAAGGSIEITPQKLAGLSYLANELVDDSNPDAAGIVLDSLAADIARKLDRAFFGSHITTPGADYNAFRPPGLESIPTDKLQLINADPSLGVDAWTDAFYAIEAQGRTVDRWVTTPAVARSLAKLKTGTGSAVPLFADFVDGKRVVFGAPVIISPYVLPGTVWGLSSPSIHTVMRKDVEATIDKSHRLDYYQTTVRAVMRAGFAFPHPAAIAKIKLAP